MTKHLKVPNTIEMFYLLIHTSDDIFYIVNSSGVNLTDAELALAQISGYWPEARELLKKKLKELESQGWVFTLDFLIYVLLGVIHNLGSKMEKLHSCGQGICQ